MASPFLVFFASTLCNLAFFILLLLLPIDASPAFDGGKTSLCRLVDFYNDNGTCRATFQCDKEECAIVSHGVFLIKLDGFDAHVYVYSPVHFLTVAPDIGVLNIAEEKLMQRKCGEPNVGPPFLKLLRYRTNNGQNESVWRVIRTNQHGVSTIVLKYGENNSVNLLAYGPGHYTPFAEKDALIESSLLRIFYYTPPETATEVAAQIDDQDNRANEIVPFGSRVPPKKTRFFMTTGIEYLEIVELETFPQTLTNKREIEQLKALGRELDFQKLREMISEIKEEEEFEKESKAAGGGKANAGASGANHSPSKRPSTSNRDIQQKDKKKGGKKGWNIARRLLQIQCLNPTKNRNKQQSEAP